MSLINCKECGHKVSDSAKACPSCGVKLRPKTPFLAKFALATITLTLIVGFYTYEGPSTTTAYRACEPLVPGLIQLPPSHAEAQQDFTAKAERVLASGVCVIDGGWSDRTNSFYFSAFRPSAPKDYFHIRLNREELKL